MPRPVSERGLLAFALAALAVWMALSAVHPVVDFHVNQQGATLSFQLHLEFSRHDEEAGLTERAEVAWRRLWSRP